MSATRLRNRRAGFTLPEVLMALLIVSGLMLTALDAVRAFEAARRRVLEDARILERRYLMRLDAIAAEDRAQSNGASPGAANWTPADGARVAPIRVGDRVGAWIVEDDGGPIAVLPQRVNAPTPCVFDPIARRCRP